MMNAPSVPFWRGRKVAVTGATGFVGFHLVRALTEVGADVTVVVRESSNRSRLTPFNVAFVEASLTDTRSLVQTFRGQETVFHAAGLVDFSGAWKSVWQTNVEGTANVVQAARSAGVSRLVFTSSIVAVGASPEPIALDETAHWSLGSLKIPYVTSKRRAEEVALAGADDRLQVVAVAPSCVLGPEDYTNSEFGSLCRRFWRGRVGLVFGGGSNYVDVRDVAMGHLLAAEQGRSGERYLLTGTNRSHQSFFADLTRIANRPIPRMRVPNVLAQWGTVVWEQWLGRRPSKSGVSAAQSRLLGLYFYFSSEKARRELGFSPRSLNETLRDTFRAWCVEHGQHKRNVAKDQKANRTAA